MHYQIIIFLLVLIGSISVPSSINAQILKKAGELLLPSHSGNSDTINPQGVGENILEELKTDSARIAELMLEVEQMRLNEILLKTQLEANNQHVVEDSLKKAAQKQRIDSLRAITPGVPVVIEEDTLFKIYAARGGHSAFDRAETTTETIIKIGHDRRLRRDSVYLLDNDGYIDIMYGDKVIISVTENDALWHSTTPNMLAETWMPIIDDKISLLKAENSFWQILKRAALFVLVIIMQYLLVKFINFLFRKLRREIIWLKVHKLKPLVIKDYELLNTKYLCRALLVICRFLRYGVLLFFFILTVPILFSIFPQTEGLALKIFDYIVDPIKMVIKSIIEYIPNLF
ncbi:MAG: mechanosensitive ion channel family protein, partial [Muribaculaceae bacterium]|nr:mechanosensitive ion channel family protein [Muribaculaceae bacterium]